MRSFASDNNAGVHPEVLKAISLASQNQMVGYGDDPYTKEAREKFRKIFGQEVQVFFVTTGTSANVLSLRAITQSFHSIICPETAHLHVDECGAPENFLGTKILTVATSDGKLTPELVQEHLKGFGFPHYAQPKVISLAQPTEMGTLYTPDELLALSALARKHNMYIQMDGARLANAAVALGVKLKEITTDVGVDVLSFGGTKNGLMLGESVVFFRPELAENFLYIQKQGMQLLSKMRFLSVQFQAYFAGDLWKKNAHQANEMAQLLAEKLQDLPALKITQKVETNAVFARIPKEAIAKIQEKYFFYVWEEASSEVRWMTSFETTEEDVEKFVAWVRQCLD